MGVRTSGASPSNLNPQRTSRETYEQKHFFLRSRFSITVYGRSQALFPAVRLDMNPPLRRVFFRLSIAAGNTFQIAGLAAACDAVLNQSQFSGA
jgi:hypothetical protein